MRLRFLNDKSISTRIAFMLTLLIFVSVAFFSILVILLARSAVYREKEAELSKTLDMLADGLKNMKPGQAAPNINGVPYYILYKITYSDGAVLSTNDPAIPSLPLTKKAKAERYFEKDFFIDGNLNLIYIVRDVYMTETDIFAPAPASVILPYDGAFRLQAAIDMDMDTMDEFLAYMPAIFLICGVFILIVSWSVSVRMTERMLFPIQYIIRQAREIGSEQLDKRLDETGADDELKELAHTFNELFTRLEADFKSQKRFTSDVSHELKTPLAVINGYVDMLARWGKDDPAVLNESLEALKKEIRSMTVLIEDLLKLNRTENALLILYERKALELVPFLAQIQKDFAIISPEAVISVDCPPDAVVFSDREGLKEVLRIIIRNSILYSTPPARITLSYADGCLSVRDRGRGIAEEDLPRIFDRFYRADKSRNRASGGSGLGLPIAKAVTERMGARLSVESVLGEGTAITIHFPDN